MQGGHKIPLCWEHTSSPIVWHPVVWVTVSVVSATAQRLLLYTNMAWGEGEGGSSESFAAAVHSGSV